MLLSLPETAASRESYGVDALVNIKIIDYGAVRCLNQWRRAFEQVLAVEYSRDGSLSDASLKCVPHLTKCICPLTRNDVFRTVFKHIFPDPAPTFFESPQIAQLSQRDPRAAKAFLPKFEIKRNMISRKAVRENSRMRRFRSKRTPDRRVEDAARFRY